MQATYTGQPRLKPLAVKTLDRAAALWFLVAVAGQTMFAFYVSSFYGRAAVRGDFAGWNQVMAHAYVAGEPLGNLAAASHLVLAVLITVGGALQLIPQIRQRIPIFHRWNGRIYVLSAFVISLLGLFMMWTRGTVGDFWQHLGTSFNAIVIMVCAVFAWRTARAGQFGRHRRWALRLFLSVSGVWFFRIGLMFWLAVNQGPVGFDIKTFTGPFLTFLSFAQYLLPLAILEIYLHTQDHAAAAGRLAMAAGLFALTLAMGMGIAVATMGMWLPRL